MGKRPSIMTGPFAIHEGTVTIQDQQLFYRQMVDQGLNPSRKNHLVFLHEGLGCTAMWHDVPTLVAHDTGLPCVVYDRSGYGRSSKHLSPRNERYLHIEAQDILPRLLDLLQIERATLIGLK